MTATQTNPEAVETKTEAVETKTEAVETKTEAAAKAAKAAKAKAAAAKAKAKAKKVEEEAEEETGLEASDAWKKSIVSKAPKSEADADAARSRLVAANGKKAHARIEMGLEWLRLCLPVAGLDADALKSMKGTHGLCQRKTKAGIVSYNGLGMLGYKNREEAAIDMGLDMREVSACSLAARSHLTLLASGIKDGLNNEKVDDLRATLLSGGVKIVEESAALVAQVVSGEVSAEEAIKVIAKAAKKGSKRGLSSIGKVPTGDLVRRITAKARANVAWLARAVDPRLADFEAMVSEAEGRKDIDEEQSGAVAEALKSMQDHLAQETCARLRLTNE